jgi:hypothetical protein
MKEYLKAAAEAKSSFAGVPCPEPDRIGAFYSGLLDDTESDAMRDHLAGCPSCLQIAKDARQFFAAVREPIETTPVRAQTVKPVIAAGATSRAERLSWWDMLVDRLRAHSALAFAVAATLLIAVVSAVLIGEIVRLRNQVEQARVAQQDWQQQVEELNQKLAQEQTRSEQLRAELDQKAVLPGPEKRAPIEPEPADRTIPPEPERAEPNIATFVLAPTLIRGFGQSSFELPRAATHVELRIGPLTEGYDNYTAALRTADGHEKWRGRGIKDQSAGQGRVISLLIPAPVFDKHDYVLRIIGVTSRGNVEEVAQYPFSVLKK